MIESKVKKLLRSTFRVVGFDIHRIVENENNKFAWLDELNISSILDIGANAGQFALEINEYLPSAEIYSFEPLKDAYLQLINNCKKINNFRAFNMALGEFNGTSKIYRNRFSDASSILEISELAVEAYPFTSNTFEEETIIRKLDHVVSESIGLKPEVLIKLDVQGYEDRVIEGGENTFNKSKVVLTEVSFQELYKGQVLFDGIYEKLLKLGFKFRGNINVFVHSTKGMPLFADAIFVRE